MSIKKINIFWIEDNPFQVGQTSSPENPRIKFPKLLAEDIFDYYLFQNVYEVQEYLEMLSDIRKNNLDIVIQDLKPDIIIFDYNMTVVSGKQLDYKNKIEYQWLKEHSISSTFKSNKKLKGLFEKKDLYLDKLKSEGFDNNLDELIEAIYDLKKEKKRKSDFEIETHYEKYSEEYYQLIKDRSHSNKDDEFGLFGGILMLSEFRYGYSVGVPASINRPDRKSLTINGAFFEWINSYDIGDAIGRKNRDDKTWESVLPFGVKLLRERIENKFLKGEIILSLEQLTKFVNGNILISDEDSYLIITTVYGIKYLPLRGLFYDGKEKSDTQLSSEIQEWAETILSNLTELVALNEESEKSELGDLITASKEFYIDFKKRILDRILLSDSEAKYLFAFYETDPHKRLVLEKNYLEFYKKKHNALKKLYCSSGKIKKEASIRNILLAYKKNEINKKRVIVLYLATKFFIDHALANEILDKSQFSLSLEKEDYYNLFNPFINTNIKINNKAAPLVMIEHTEQKGASNYHGAFEKWFAKDTFQITEKLDDDGIKIGQTGWWKFESWISDSEKLILNSIFVEDLNRISNKPKWLL